MLSPHLARLLAGMAWLLALLPAAAAETFYQGKQLVLLVNFAQGGPSDAEARLLARHLAKHVVGSPSTIVHNMSGSSGAVGANWLASAAAPDGLIVGYFSGIASMRALGDPTLSEAAAALTFISAGPGVSVTYARTDIGGSLKKPGDILKRKEFWVGGIAPGNDRDVRLRMQLDLIGARYGYISGYAGASEARQAFQRGDIQVFIEPLRAYRAAIEPGPVSAGLAMPLWFDPLDDGETFSRSAEADGVPALTFTDFLIQARGELPKSQLFEAWRLMNHIGTTFQRLLVMPPNTPAAAIKALQKAIQRLDEDAAFKEDALKTLKFVPTFVVDDRTAALFRQVVEPAPALQAFIRDYVAKVKADAPKKPAP